MKKKSLPIPEGRGLLSDWVTSTLREGILNGYFLPKEKIHPKKLAMELNVSQTPIREAIRRLEAERLITSIPHHGAYVSDVSEQEIREVFEIRRLLEVESVLQLTSLVPEDAIDELENSGVVMLRNVENSKFDGFHINDSVFHETLLNYAPNSLIIDILESLRNRIALVRIFAASRPGDHIIKAINEHLLILSAIRQRDKEKASELMRLHIERSSDRIAALSIYEA